MLISFHYYYLFKRNDENIPNNIAAYLGPHTLICPREEVYLFQRPGAEQPTPHSHIRSVWTQGEQC